MNLAERQQHLIKNLSTIYDQSEAMNIAKLVVESVTGGTVNKTEPKNISLKDEEAGKIHSIEKRLLQHEPVQYILNEAWFYDIPFYVDKNVLIPRPETEELTEWVIKEHCKKDNVTIIDIGTGSGCIPVILRRKLPQVRVLSCDISETALRVAEKNATKYNTKIDFLLLDILDKNYWHQLPKADVIVSNPPYIPINEKKSLNKNVADYEPEIALFVPDNNPLIFYETIAMLGKEKLNKAGCIYVEIHEELSNVVTTLFEKMKYQVSLKKDLQGKNRMIKAIVR